MNDKVKITLISGKGGDGAIAFRREKSVDKGGPFGGNGGRGGSIYFVASLSVNTLKNYRFGKIIRAEDGQNGKTKLQYGKDGKDTILLVPCGTVILDENNNVLADLVSEGEKYLAMKGGRGGRGNAAFKSSKRKTPNFAENGMPSEKKNFYLELKLLADVGLVGKPNAGKSTILDATTRAKPLIASYPFTTIEPMTGVCFLDDERFFVLGDIPGLIKGASEGKGLGYQFLRHIERCLVLLHVLDISSSTLIEDFEMINNEIYNYKPELISLPMIICLNKTDNNYDLDQVNEFKNKYSKYPIIEISALNKDNLDNLKQILYETVIKEKDKIINTSTKEVIYKANKVDNKKIPDFEIVQLREHYYEIIGPRVIRTKKLINIKTDEGMDRLLLYLEKININEKLKEAGVISGDTVLLDDFEFEYFE